MEENELYYRKNVETDSSFMNIIELSNFPCKERSEGFFNPKFLYDW